ncbi:MAG: hypothetical protein IPK64_21680 [bacterium]|nr:hypothetical protein [bacterium]
MKKNPLLGALPIIAKAVGDRLGVRVVIGQTDEAETDGDTIHLPALPAEDAALAALANGFIDHEAAHVRFTDFGVPKGDGLAGQLANVLEDARVERALCARYPGCRDNLAAMVAALEAQEPCLPPPGAPLSAQVVRAVDCLLRARLSGQGALSPAADALEARLDAALPPGAVAKLLALAFEVRHATSTGEAVALAGRMVALLEEEASPPPDGNGGAGAAPSDGGAGSPGAGAGGPSGTGGPDSGAASSDGGAGSPGAGAGGPSGTGGPDSGAASSDGGAGSPGAGAGAASQGLDARRAALAAMLAEPDAPGGFEGVGERASARVTAAARRGGPARARLAEYGKPPPERGSAAAAAAARAATAALRRRLGALVQASAEDDRRCGRRGRRPDTRSLHRPCAGQPVRFCAREARAAPRTAVGLLLDRSGSMSPVIGLAARAVLATALALETVPDVACWAAAFPGGRDGEIVPLKPFAARAARVAGRFALSAHGGTPLADALWRAAYELLRRPEPRRLLVVATDGRPCSVEAARDLLARCRAGGIEVMGLGIGQSLDAVREVFGARDAAAIGAIEELAPALFGLLERRLTRAA